MVIANVLLPLLLIATQNSVDKSVSLEKVCMERMQAYERQAVAVQRLEDEIRQLLERVKQGSNSTELGYKVVTFGHQNVILGKLEHERTLACERKLEWTKIAE